MWIKAIEIEDFGRFHKKRISFSPGLNIITGKNESGKTTVCRFIRAMLYGLERERGLRARRDDYTRFFPWEYGRFQGSLELCEDGEVYRILRNFRAEQKELCILRLSTGQEMSRPEQFLKEIRRISEAAYCNTLWVENHCVTGEVLAEEMENYLANLSMAGTVCLDVQGSLEALRGKKKELRRRLPEAELAKLRTIILSQEQEEAREQELRTAMEQLLTEEAALEEKERRGMLLPPALVQAWEETAGRLRERGAALLEEQLHYRRKRRLLAGCGLMSGLTFFLSGTVLLAKIFKILPESFHGNALSALAVSLSVAAGAGLAAVLMRCRILRNREALIQKQKKATETEIAEENEKQLMWQQECQREWLSSMLEERKRLLADRERLCFELERTEEKKKRTELAKEQWKEVQKRKEELEWEMEAIELACVTMSEASSKLYEEFGRKFQQRLSEYVTGFTDAAYERLVADEKLSLGAFTKERRVLAGEVSYGTKEQFFLALRLAVADVFDREQRLPLILDDSLAAFDKQRLESTLRCLSDCGRQVLLFSGTGREETLAGEMGITYQGHDGI